MRESAGERGVPGVRALDHTADIGIDVQASSRAELFHRAALGTMAMLYGEPEDARAASGGPGTERRVLELAADSLPELLVRWLRELLYLHEVHGVDYRSASFDRLDDARLEARVAVAAVREPPVREIKGVTYHGLRAGPQPDADPRPHEAAPDPTRGAGVRWRARVVFDV